MPTYLIHGFRWIRHSIRIHIILQNLEDAAPEWLLAPATSITLLNNFYSQYNFLPPSNPPPSSYRLPSAPSTSIVVEDESDGRRRLTGDKGKGPASSQDSIEGSSSGTRSDTGGAMRSATSHPSQKVEERIPAFNDWSVVKLMEQYDPDNEEVVSQPYAYVGDYMVQVGVSASITEEIAKYENSMKQGKALRPSALESSKIGWIEKLRDSLEKEAQMGWFVVFCGDEERYVPSEDEMGGVDVMGGEDVESGEEEPVGMKTPRSAGLKGFFQRKKSRDGKSA